MNSMVKLKARFLTGTEEERSFWVDPWAVSCMYATGSGLIMRIDGCDYLIDDDGNDSLQRILEARKIHVT